MAKEERQTQTAIRVPESWLARLDAVAEALSRPGLPVNRAEAMRVALAQGLADLEAELLGKKMPRRR